MEQNAKTSAEGAPKFSLNIVDVTEGHMYAALGIPEDRLTVLTEALKSTFARLDADAKGNQINSVGYLGQLIETAENTNEFAVLVWAFAVNFGKRLSREREKSSAAHLLASLFSR